MTDFSHDRQLSIDAKREVYGVVLQRSAAADEEVLKMFRGTTISVDDVKTILKLYDMPPRPISITASPK